MRRQDEPLEPWLEAFFVLEESGWKGRAGSALACAPHRVSYTRDSLKRFDKRGKLIFWKLTINDRPIAMQFATIEGDTVYLEKIAYDEAYARFSPGVLLVLEGTRNLLGRSDISFVNSTAMPNNPMIDNIWRDRLAFADMLIAAPGTPASLFRAFVAAEQLRATSPDLMKTVAKHLWKRRTPSS